MKGTCEKCYTKGVYLFRVPIATPKGEDKKIEMWCKECIDDSKTDNYDVS